MSTSDSVTLPPVRSATTGRNTITVREHRQRLARLSASRDEFGRAVEHYEAARRLKDLLSGAEVASIETGYAKALNELGQKERALGLIDGVLERPGKADRVTVEAMRFRATLTGKKSDFKAAVATAEELEVAEFARQQKFLSEWTRVVQDESRGNGNQRGKNRCRERDGTAAWHRSIRNTLR